MSGPALAIVLGLFSAITLAFANVAVKRGGDILTGRAILSATSALFMVPAAFFVPLPAPATWTALAIAVPVHFLYQAALIRALHRGDLSLVFPIMRGTAPLLTAVAAFFWLGETLSLTSFVGLIIATLSVIVFALPPGSERLRAHPDRQALFWAGVTAIGIALYNVADARGTRIAGDPITYIVWIFLLDWIGVGVTALVVRRGALLGVFYAQWRYGAAAGILSILSYGSALYAFTLIETAKVSALRETAVVFAALLGWLFLKEGFGGRRVIAALALAAGLVVMQIAG